MTIKQQKHPKSQLKPEAHMSVPILLTGDHADASGGKTGMKRPAKFQKEKEGNREKNRNIRSLPIKDFLSVEHSRKTTQCPCL